MRADALVMEVIIKRGQGGGGMKVAEAKTRKICPVMLASRAQWSTNSVLFNHLTIYRAGLIKARAFRLYSFLWLVERPTRAEFLTPALAMLTSGTTPDAE